MAGKHEKEESKTDKKPKKKNKRGQGEGSIRKRKRGNTELWEVRITVGLDDEGKQRQISKYFKSWNDARDWRTNALNEIRTGTFAGPTKITFGEWLNRWLTVYIKPRVKPGSYANYEHVARIHIIPVLGNIPLQSLRTNTIQEFYNKKSESGKLSTVFFWELPKPEIEISLYSTSTRLESVVKWLQEVLAKGPRDKREIETLAQEKDISLSMLRTAKNKLGIKLHKKTLENKSAGRLSPRIIHLMHQVINGALKQAVRENLISINPAEHTTRPGLKYKEMQPLNSDEVNRYLEAAKGDRLYPAFLLELTTGARRGELLAVRWDCLDLANGTLAIKSTLARVRLVDKGSSELLFSEPKTESGKRIIPLMPEVIQELKKHKARQNEEKLFFGQAYQDNNLVFCTEVGKPIEPRNFFRLHTKILKKAGLPHVRFHDLRHTFATIILQEGENPENLRDLLGHSKTSTTLDLYCHSTMDGKKKAISRLSGIIKA